jgi:D-alanine-D-alanine ligase
MSSRQERQGGECFAEAYIEGREFNLSLLASKAGPQVLPPAEIRFEDYPEGKTRIVGYRAKWHEGSFEYLHTVRSFEFPPQDSELILRLTDLATRCWCLFDLRGYARVDFRVDREGRPWVLEVNVNPCLSPDAGFYAAAAQTGLSFTQVVERIIGDCLGAAGQG